MPFKSEAQRRFLWANHPEIAQRWAKEGKKKMKKRVKEAVMAMSLDAAVDQFCAMAFDESKHPRGESGTHQGGKFIASGSVEAAATIMHDTGTKKFKVSEDSKGLRFKRNPKSFHREMINNGYDQVSSKTYRSHNGGQEHNEKIYSDGEDHYRVTHTTAAGYSGGYRESHIEHLKNL